MNWRVVVACWCYLMGASACELAALQSPLLVYDGLVDEAEDILSTDDTDLCSSLRSAESVYAALEVLARRHEVLTARLLAIGYERARLTNEIKTACPVELWIGATPIVDVGASPAIPIPMIRGGGGRTTGRVIESVLATMFMTDAAREQYLAMVSPSTREAVLAWRRTNPEEYQVIWNATQKSVVVPSFDEVLGDPNVFDASKLSELMREIGIQLQRRGN